MGTCDLKDNAISINSDLPKDNKEESLVHEIFEYLNDSFELELDHYKICTLSNAWYSIMKDNGINWRMLK